MTSVLPGWKMWFCWRLRFSRAVSKSQRVPLMTLRLNELLVLLYSCLLKSETFSLNSFIT